jgi:protein SCO1/2
MKELETKIKSRIKKGCRVLWGGLWAALFLTACHRESGPVTTPGSDEPRGADRQTFAVNGVVKELEPDGKTAVIQHEAISNYMAAMTMPFEVRDPKELRGLKAGDAISFHLVVTSKEGWIEDVALRQKSADASPAPAAVHISRAVEPLEEGDLLPDYHFTNELGQAVSLGQYKGHEIAFTFFFTRCPFPNFCPRMTANFAEAEAQLRQRLDAPAGWHLFSISFDPTNDTPQLLETYAKNEHYDPGHWSFLTGDPAQVGELADQFGESFWWENGSIGHNLRTVVVDARGRVRKIYSGNKWTSAELVQEMINGAVNAPRAR